VDSTLLAPKASVSWDGMQALARPPFTTLREHKFDFGRAKNFGGTGAVPKNLARNKARANHPTMPLDAIPQTYPTCMQWIGVAKPIYGEDGVVQTYASRAAGFSQIGYVRIQSYEIRTDYRKPAANVLSMKAERWPTVALAIKSDVHAPNSSYCALGANHLGRGSFDDNWPSSNVPCSPWSDGGCPDSRNKNLHIATSELPQFQSAAGYRSIFLKRLYPSYSDIVQQGMRRQPNLVQPSFESMGGLQPPPVSTFAPTPSYASLLTASLSPPAAGAAAGPQLAQTSATTPRLARGSRIPPTAYAGERAAQKRRGSPANHDRRVRPAAAECAGGTPKRYSAGAAAQAHDGWGPSRSDAIAVARLLASE